MQADVGAAADTGSLTRNPFLGSAGGDWILRGRGMDGVIHIDQIVAAAR